MDDGRTGGRADGQADGQAGRQASLSRNSFFSITEMKGSKQANFFCLSHHLFVNIMGDCFTKVEINEWAAAPSMFVN